jgi:twitching motility protein PilT
MDPEQTGKLHQVIQEGEYYGMQTFDQALLTHLQAGRITMEEALKAATHPHDFKLLVGADGRRNTSMEDVAEARGATHQAPGRDDEAPTPVPSRPPDSHAVSAPAGPPAPSAPPPGVPA